MAGTRGIAGLRGEQIRAGVLRDYHFDSNYKIGEDKVNIQWGNHREILEDTKIDVFVQVNDVAVAGLSELDVTADVGGRPVSTGTSVEGVVLTEKVQIRATGTDSPIGDADSDVVYGRLEENAGVYTLKFYSIVGGTEQPYTFDAGAGNIDYRFVVRTNLSVIPVDAIIKGGAGFVEGATDARAYMNLIQLMKDIYGSGGSLDNDGNANLAKSIVDQIADVEEAIGDVGSDISDLEERVTTLENEDEEEVYEAEGDETEYDLVKGVARPGSVLLFINGAVQAPGINFVYKTDGNGNITGFDFAPDTLKVVNGVPDVLYVKYKKVTQ
jgi:hypothetical protein